MRLLHLLFALHQGAVGENKGAVGENKGAVGESVYSFIDNEILSALSPHDSSDDSNGDGSDEVMGGYLYISKAENHFEFDRECKRLLKDIHQFDVLRSDKSISAAGLEARVPFGDLDFVKYVMSLDPSLKMFNDTKIEKDILRKSFEGYLPDELLYRQKEAIQFNHRKNIIPSVSKPNMFESLYKTDISGCFTPIDCSCVIQVVYKPRNMVFAQDNSVASSLYVNYIKEKTITQNQYNITNKWGIDNVNSFKKYPCNPYNRYTGNLQPAGGSVNRINCSIK